MEEVYYLDKADFFLKNIRLLLDIRKRNEINFDSSHNLVLDSNGFRDATEEDRLVIEFQSAINSSILTNCFALFESSFEKFLIEYYINKNFDDQLNEKISKLQKLIRLSGYDKFENEFKSLTENNIKKMFIYEKEYEAYIVFSELFPLRSYLIHGSNYIMRAKNDDSILFLNNSDDPKYHEMLNFINKKLTLKLSKDEITFDILISRNDVISYLIKSLNLVLQVFNPNRKNILIDIIF